jgi:beta-phosphoglucomutase
MGVKLAIFDLDGTLFDTKNVNYASYSDAIRQCGYNVDIDYRYYCDFCNGNSYKVFLPQIIHNITENAMHEIHEKKKAVYISNIGLAVKNEHLFSIIDLISPAYKVALVTTASRKNTDDILKSFNTYDVFDIILTGEDVSETKPSPECFLKAMEIAKSSADDTLIFEDSDTGLEAARRSGAKYMKVYGYN